MTNNNIQNELNTSDSAFIQTDDLYNKQTKAVPIPEKDIGIDTQKEFFSSIVNSALSGQLDMTALEGFNRVTQSRDQIYVWRLF